MRVLVTGAAGLYGIHMVDALVKRGDCSKVIGVDDFSREFLVRDPFALVASKDLEEKFELLRMDFRDLDVKLLDSLNVDIVIHYAACVSIPESTEMPVKYFEINEYGTFKFLQNLLRTNNQPFFIYASSPEVYGNPVYTPMDTNHPLNPISVYAATKLAAEKHCQALHQWHKYPLAIMRNFNTYGENQNTGSYAAVIPNFIRKALLGETLIVHDDGDQARDFLYIKDAIRVYNLLIDEREECRGETFNIGTGKETSINKLSEEIICLTGSKSKVIHQPGRKTDLDTLCADISHTMQKLGWKPEINLEGGLLRTIAWLRGVI